MQNKSNMLARCPDNFFLNMHNVKYCASKIPYPYVYVIPVMYACMYVVYMDHENHSVSDWNRNFARINKST